MPGVSPATMHQTDLAIDIVVKDKNGAELLRQSNFGEMKQKADSSAQDPPSVSDATNCIASLFKVVLDSELGSGTNRLWIPGC